MTDFNLSEKIYEWDGIKTEEGINEDILSKKDVKEFIRLLKEDFKEGELFDKEELCEVIDELAGEKLT